MRRLVPLPPSKCLSPHSVYSGHQSVLVPPLELESNVSLWLSAVSQYKARVTFCSYSVMEMCTKGLGAQTGALRVKCKNQRWGVGGAIQLQGSSKPSHLFPNQRGGYLRGQGRGGRGLRVSSSASVLRTPRVKTDWRKWVCVQTCLYVLRSPARPCGHPTDIHPLDSQRKRRGAQTACAVE